MLDSKTNRNLSVLLGMSTNYNLFKKLSNKTQDLSKCLAFSLFSLTKMLVFTLLTPKCRLRIFTAFGKDSMINFILVIFFPTYISESNHKPYLRVLSAHSPYQELLMINRLSNLINSNRLAAKISQVLLKCSSVICVLFQVTKRFL